MSRDSLEETSQHSDNLQHGNRTDESWFFVAQLPIDDVACLARLFRVILKEIAEDDVGIETNHRLKRPDSAYLNGRVHLLDRDGPLPSGHGGFWLRLGVRC